MATAKEWDDTSPPCRAGVFFPGVPTYYNFTLLPSVNTMIALEMFT